MKPIVIAQILFTACAALTTHSCFAQSSEYSIRGYSDGDGNDLRWYVSSAAHLKNPEWKFDGTTPPPLDWTVAYGNAVQWLKQNRKKFDSFTLRSLSMEQYGPSDAPSRWYYFLEFSGTLDGELVFAGGALAVMVLMDGTIVEPRLEK